MTTLIRRELLYRPRDIIYYFGRVLYHANRRQVAHLMKRDFDTALREYSGYALQALSAEWCPYIPDLEELLLEFWGGLAEITDAELRSKLASSGVEPNDTEEAVRFLVEAQFLGLGIDEHNYQYAVTPIRRALMMRQLRRFVHRQGGERRFRIHRSFHHSLALTEQSRRKFVQGSPTPEAG